MIALQINRRYITLNAAPRYVLLAMLFWVMPAFPATDVLVDSPEQDAIVKQSLLGRSVDAIKELDLKVKKDTAEPTITVDVQHAPKALAENVQQSLQTVLVSDVTEFKEALPRLRMLAKEAASAVGYYHAQFKFQRTANGKNVIVIVNAGEPVRIKKCAIVIDSADPEIFAATLASFPLTENEIFNHGTYNALKTAIARKAQDLGFFDATWLQHDVAVDAENNAAYITLHYNTGHRYVLGTVKFSHPLVKGLSNSKGRAENLTLPLELTRLNQLVPFAAGVDYDVALVAKLSRNLSSTRYFSTLRVVTNVPDPLPEKLVTEKTTDNPSQEAPQSAVDSVVEDALTVDDSEDNADTDAFAGFYVGEQSSFDTPVLNNTADNFSESFASKAIRQAKVIDIDVFVDAENPNSAEVGLGYASDVGVRLKSRYRRAIINEAGHSAELNFEVSKVRQSVDTRYTMPYKDPLIDTVGLFVGAAREIDNVGQELLINSLTAGVERNINPENSQWQRTLGLRYTIDTLSNAGNVSASNLPQKFQAAGIPLEQKALLAGYSLSKRYSTGGLDPTQGFKQYYQLDMGSRSLLTQTNLLILRAGWRGLIGLDSAANHELVGRLDVGTMFATNFNRVPYKLRFFAGGDQSIRGYDNKSLAPTDSDGYLIGGQSLAVGSVEYNYRIREHLRLAVFADAGNAYSKQVHEPLKIGVGPGIRWLSPVGPLSLDLGFSMNPTNGNTGSVRFSFFLGPAF